MNSNQNLTFISHVPDCIGVSQKKNYSSKRIRAKTPLGHGLLMGHNFKR
jgi:hypothetical protein